MIHSITIFEDNLEVKRKYKDSLKEIEYLWQKQRDFQAPLNTCTNKTAKKFLIQKIKS